MTSPAPINPGAMTTQQAAAYLQAHPQSLRRWAARGRILTLHAGRSLRFARSDLDAFMRGERPWRLTKLTGILAPKAGAA